jgi:hypothetical protein
VDGPIRASREHATADDDFDSDRATIGGRGGGLITSAFLTLEIIPVIYTYWRYAQLKKAQRLARPLAEVAGIEL